MKGNMNKVLIALVTWFCWTVVFGLARVYPLQTNGNSVAIASFTITRYGETDKADYLQFMEDIRSKLGTGTPSHGIPVLPVSVSKNQKYTTVELINSGNKKVTIGLNVLDLYVVAYKLENQNSYFFNDPKFKDATDYLFKDTKQNPLKISGNYESLKTQGGDRETVYLGVGQLDSFIYTLYESTLPKDIAKPLVCIIQMVSEATRYKYIENEVVKHISDRFLPKGDIISRENKWQDLSEAIQKSVADEFTKPVQLQAPDYNVYNVYRVQQVKDDMGLLLNQANSGETEDITT
ncbi:hypothetical protein JCGZ_10881 [Jatropha curcas]|uniref:rRNA N-glycosylase n=1 Tax=Jatropha curcas TaxID=180498 RepID=I3V673_JATCU|nr:ribosome-inactivating protein cucurmosin-like precursor [Jatropha curcas]XP_020536134.1 ribosome-inactivating protein cucurmosin-like isoform X1 [Jatropha curcas]AFK73426.1 type 1 ribosomal inactivating protein [Jatropha curcas]KDP34676.1 hypothetical protein JCGZ_10881 [Jatropha curcas]